MPLNFTKTAVTLRVKLASKTIERHAPASPYLIGEELGKLVYQYAKDNKLGYFPPYEYFLNSQSLNDELVSSMESITWLIAELAREEIRVKLRPVFSSVQFEAIQTTAYTMPTIRFNQQNVLHKLIKHFTPDSVKVSLVGTAIRKHEMDEKVELQLIKHQIRNWLEKSFHSIEVSHIDRVNNEEG